MKHLLLCLLILVNFITSAQQTPQDRAENVIREHIKKTFPDKEYHGYDFGDLYKNTPLEITELEEIKKEAELIDVNNDSLVAYYDSTIKLRLKDIKENRLFSTYEINHFFTLKEKYKQPILYEYQFSLFPDGKIKDVEKKLEYELSNDDYNYYYYFYKKKDLYNNGDENIKIYTYLTDLYESETISKEAALSNVLTVCQIVYKYEAYDTVLIARLEAQKWLYKNLSNPVIKEYSDVNPIIDTNNNEVLGYNIFTKITINDSTEAYYFEFDYDYILRGVLPVEAPFEKYFGLKKTINE